MTKKAARKGLNKLWKMCGKEAHRSKGAQGSAEDERQNKHVARKRVEDLRRRSDKRTRHFLEDERQSSMPIEGDWRTCGGSATKKHSARKGLEKLK